MSMVGIGGNSHATEGKMPSSSVEMVPRMERLWNI